MKNADKFCSFENFLSFTKSLKNSLKVWIKLILGQEKKKFDLFCLFVSGLTLS